jgi:hypothetical protein
MDQCSHKDLVYRRRWPFSIALSAWGLHPLLLLLIAGGAVILADQIIRTGRKIVLAPLSILRSAAS